MAYPDPSNNWSVGSACLICPPEQARKEFVDQLIEEVPIEECPHTDGAILVAEYIVQEIKKNVKSTTANILRDYVDLKTHEEQMKQWYELPWYRRYGWVPELRPVAGMTLWAMTVNTNRPWDHKPKIRKKFPHVAVHRPLESGRESETYYHKYKEHDYFLDVWSNIHYGYVGLSVGIDKETLLWGADRQQMMNDGGGEGDTIDDITSINIGFTLHEKFGRYAEELTAQDVLDALEKSSEGLPESQQAHWCWHPKNEKPKKRRDDQ